MPFVWLSGFSVSAFSLSIAPSGVPSWPGILSSFWTVDKRSLGILTMVVLIHESQVLVLSRGSGHLFHDAAGMRRAPRV